MLLARMSGVNGPDMPLGLIVHNYYATKINTYVLSNTKIFCEDREGTGTQSPPRLS
jgi:hypothetical protein